MKKTPMDAIFNHWDHITTPIFDDMSCLFDQVFGAVQGGYPPHDIERDANGVTVITVALAGLKRDDLEVYVENDVLSIKYDKPAVATDMTEGSDDVEKSGVERSLAHVFHHGIARRSFHLKFRLTNGVEVASGTMEDGLLRVQLKKAEPETNRTKVEIG